MRGYHGEELLVSKGISLDENGREVKVSQGVYDREKVLQDALQIRNRGSKITIKMRTMPEHV